jgi:hypothetical protein
MVVYADASDPRLLRVTNDDGVFEYYALRDATGIPTAITGVVVDNADGRTRFDLDGLGLPVEAFAANGTHFSFEWDLAARAVIVTIVSPSGESQVSTLVDLAAQPFTARTLSVGGPATAAQARARNRAPRGGIPARAVARPSTFAWTGDEPTLALGSTPSGQVLTSVSDCGLPAGDLQVLTRVTDVSNSAQVGVFPAHYLGGGLFSTTIPLGQETVEANEETCAAIADALGTVCTLLDALGPAAATTICSALSAAIDFATFPSGEAALLISGCLSAIPLMETYCSTLGAAPAPGAPDLAQRLCEAVFDNTVYSSQLELVSCVAALPANVCSLPQVVDAAGLFPVTLFVDLGSNSAIRTLTLDPSSPAQDQDYVATADISCLPAGSTVRLSIVGTDGYEDSVLYEIEESLSESMFDLLVPGAETGVRDTVTAELTLPGGQTKTLTAFLVFGV